MWGTKELEDNLGHFSWTLRLAKNIVGYLVVIVPFLVCKFFLDRAKFNEKSSGKSYFRKLIGILFYGHKTEGAVTFSKKETSVRQDDRTLPKNK